MAKRIPFACSPENCGDNYAVCGTSSTYTNRACRCVTCTAGHSGANVRRQKTVKSRNHGECSPDNCGDLFVLCGSKSTYDSRKCRCSACRVANNAYNRARHAANKLRNFGDCTPDNCGDIYGMCGRYTTYTAHKCRCEACIDARNTHKRDRYEDDPSKAKNAAHTRRAKIKGVLNIPYTDEQLAAKYAYWGDICHLQGPTCTGTVEDIEHVIPISSDGPNVLANIRPSCEPCNSAKWATWPYPIRLIPGGKVKQ